MAVECAGRPSAAQVVALLWRTNALPVSVTPVVRDGPLCAGSWQYTVVVPAQREPLQVVTRGEPDALSLVTAGSSVCTVEVRTAAPTGIRIAAHC